MQEVDIQLIQRAARGDTDAFTDFFDQYYQQVFNFALWLCNDADQAEDLTQETFIKAHSNLHRLGPPYNARPWLYRIARNLFVDSKRRAPAVQALDQDAPLASGEPDPERQMMRTELAGVVRRAMQRLTPNYREALVLREVEGFRYDEIAGIMGVSLDGVKVLLHRARLSFKDHYGVRLLTEEPLPECTVLQEVLDSFYDGEALEAQERAVRAHLRDCSTCLQRTRELAALGILFKAQPHFKPPVDMRRKALARANRRQTPRRAVTITAVIGALLLIGGVVVASGGMSRGGGGPVGPGTATIDEPTPTVPIIFPDIATDLLTPGDTPTGTVTNTPDQAGPVPAGVTPTTGSSNVSPAPDGADGSLCGDGICQSGESASWCGDCSQSGDGGSVTEPPKDGITIEPPIEPPLPVCGNGILEVDEACESDDDCVGSPYGTSCFVPGCFCGPG